MAACLAYIWIVYLGSLCVQEGWVKVIHRTDRCDLTLQRYLMKYLVKAPFPVREIGPVMALLHAFHVPQDLIRLEDFEGQHHCQ